MPNGSHSSGPDFWSDLAYVNKRIDFMEKRLVILETMTCPDCDSKLLQSSGRLDCTNCSWSSQGRNATT